MLPTLGSLFGIPINSYGTAISVALVVGIVLAWRLRPVDIYSARDVLNLSLIGLGALCVLPALIGLVAALGPGEAGEGGRFSAIPTALGAAAGFFLYGWKRKIPLVPTLDALLPILSLGMGIVRCGGCFLAGCCFGLPTDVPWGLHFPPGSPAALRFPGAAVHPTQLYLGAAAILSGLVLLSAAVRRRLPPGWSAALTLDSAALAYGLATYFRGDIPPDRLIVHRLAALGVFLGSGVILMLARRASSAPTPAPPARQRRNVP